MVTGVINKVCMFWQLWHILDMTLDWHKLMNHRSVIVICLKHIFYTDSSIKHVHCSQTCTSTVSQLLQCFSSLVCPSGCAYCEFVASSETTKCTHLGCESHYYQVDSMDCEGVLCFQGVWFVYI